MDRIFFFGYPKAIGGANTEAWHTLRLFRQNDLEVTCIPTWSDPAPGWQEKLTEIGCQTVRATPESLHEVPGLAGATVLAMCNQRFVHEAWRVRRLGCRIVFANCMNWPVEWLLMDHRDHGCFDRYVFQSNYQRDQLVPQLRRYGYQDDQGFLIRGAFDPTDFTFAPRPHEAGEMLAIGRVSRSGPDKFPADFWRQYRRILSPIWASVMGWSDEVEDKCGPPAVWAEVLPVGAKPVGDFLERLHVLAPGVGSDAVPAAIENWPRVGLEAMAKGVALVVEKRGGWPEMIEHAQTGFLCQDSEDMAFYASLLARDEALRQQIVHDANWELRTRLAEPKAIWQSWQCLFEGLKGD